VPSEQITPGEFSAAVAAVTNAFGDPSRRAIFLMAREQEGGVTATEAADRFDLHPNVARHHLDKLAAGGYVDVSVERGHTGAGRPSKRYRASTKDTGLDFPARRDDLLVTLLGRALSLLSADDAALMAEDVGYQYGLSLAEQMAPGDSAHRSFQTALHAVADALTAHGFAAHAEARGGSIAIIAEQCPFGATATAHPVVCAVDRGMVRGMLAGLYGDTLPATEASRPQGDDVCVTVV
jgi:predicted ArsR family transcriptional regulator